MTEDKVLEIVVKRFARLGKALHGRLWIAGEHVCDTLENADRCLPPGVYRLVRTNGGGNGGCTVEEGGTPSVVLVAANGPFCLGKGEVAIGECHYLGFLIHCQDCYVPLMERVRKAASRHKKTTVVILGDDGGGRFFLKS